jgi:hypothetical protein
MAYDPGYGLEIDMNVICAPELGGTLCFPKNVFRSCPWRVSLSLSFFLCFLVYLCSRWRHLVSLWRFRFCSFTYLVTIGGLDYIIAASEANYSSRSMR